MQPSGLSLLLVEAGITVIGVLVALSWPRAGANWLSRIEAVLLGIARRRRLAVLATGCCAIAIRLAILPILPIPQPFIHDEFSYRLAGDTFASGRLTNPTHPLWQYFESFHISHLPSYMSMYFPAQGMVLAAGQLLTGHPWFGVCFAAALMCAAICWMLQGWLPPGWALLGGGLALLRLGVFSYWANSYYGGAVPAIGGALVLGALPRILRRFRTRDGLIMAAGAIVLGTSRPFEGLLLCFPAVAAALWSIFRRKQFRMIAAPAVLLVAAAAAMGYYDYRVFGNPLTLPYQTNRVTYASAPVFVWQSARPEPSYRYAEMRNFYINWEMKDYNEARTPGGFVNHTVQKAGIVLFFVFGVTLLTPLIMVRRVLKDRRLRYIVVAGTIFAAGLTTNVWLFPHYIAPFAAGFYAILIQAMRHLGCWRPNGQPTGRALTRMTVIACILLAGLRIAGGPLNLTTPRWPSMWYGTEPFGLPRAIVAAELAKRPGKQLAIVRYAPDHAPFDDWVYNAADIDRQGVVWARDMGGEKNLPLLRYFKDRSVWLVEPDAVPPRVTPLGVTPHLEQK
jgi:hypothetical protein